MRKIKEKYKERDFNKADLALWNKLLETKLEYRIQFRKTIVLNGAAELTKLRR